MQEDVRKKTTTVILFYKLKMCMIKKKNLNVLSQFLETAENTGRTCSASSLEAPQGGAAGAMTISS